MTEQKKIGLTDCSQRQPEGSSFLCLLSKGRGGRDSYPSSEEHLPSILLLMLSVKQRGIEYHFSSLWYDLTRIQTLVSHS